MSISFNRAVAWWRDLQPDRERGRSGDRAALANLRRCATVAEAMQEPATFALYRHGGGTGPDDLAAAALTAAVLAHVREDDPANRSVARRIGPDNTDQMETALVKPLRFRRLMEAGSDDERLIAFRRLAAIAGQKLNVGDLCGALLNWSDDRKRRWIYDYWNAGNPAQTKTPSQAKEITP
jgi:CRISPR system Cascade subunit CasB